MSTKTCTACGAPLALDVIECKFCGEKLVANAQAPQYQQQPQYQQPQYQQQQQPQYQQVPQYQQQYVVQKPYKNKTTAGLLGIFLGALGVHKFYLGNIGMGILYLLFCWTYIPGVIGFIEGIIYLCSSEESFMRKYVS